MARRALLGLGRPAAQARPRSEWGRLGVRVRDQRNARSLPGAFGIEWFETYWVQGHQGRRAIHTRYLRRGKGLRYPRSTLSRVAKPWELAMADEFEEHFALIRGLLHSIAQVRKVLRQAPGARAFDSEGERGAVRCGL